MTVFGYIQGFAVLLFVTGIMISRLRWQLFLNAVVLFVVAIGYHSFITPANVVGFRTFQLPNSPIHVNIWSKIFDERDIVFVGTELYAPLTGAEPFLDVFEKQYEDLKAKIGWPLPTPLLSSLSEKRSSYMHWVTEFPNKTPTKSKAAIYLHGNYGAYTIQCWLVASILLEQGYSTICPGLSFEGNWSSEAGKKVLKRTIDYARKQYPSDKILFVGLSNGANGLVNHRSWLSDYATGFVLISGGHSQVFKDKLPTLLLWGERDQNIPFERAKKIKHLNPNTTFEFVYEDHSAFVRRHGYFKKIWEDWAKKEKIIR